MKASSARNSNGMRVENNSTDNVKNVAVASSPNGPSFEEEKRCDISKPKRHTGKATISRDIGDKKQIGNESPKLTYTSEDGIHYEPGGLFKNSTVFHARTLVQFKIMHCLPY